MDKKKMGKAFLFAIITVVLMLFYMSAFGLENGGIGMMIGLTSYALTRTDLTAYPIYKTAIFIFLNVYLAISSYFITINPFLGFIINTINLFSILFIYMREFKSSISYLFLMTYIIMWEDPTTLENLPKRIIAIIVGVFIIIVINFIFNRNKFKKSSKNIILGIIKNLETEIENLLNGDCKKEENQHIHKELRKLMLLLDERNSNALRSNNKDNIYFNIILILERINTIIYNVGKGNLNKNFKEDYLEILKSELESLENALSKKVFLEDDNSVFKNLSEKYKSCQENKKAAREGIELIRMLRILFNNLNKYKQDEVKNIYESKKNFKELIGNKSIWGLRNLGVSYSFKVALTVSIAIFIIEILKLPQGKWMVTTIFVLIQPFKEETITKAKNRFKGTILGVSMYLIIYTFIPQVIPVPVLMLVILFAYYMFTDYDKKVICMALLILSLEGHGQVLIPAFHRFIYVFIGAIIALIVNKYFFPYSKCNIIDDLKDRYVELTNNLIEELRKAKENGFNNENVFRLMLNCSFLESKLIGSEKFENSDSFNQFVRKQSNIIRKMRLFILLVHYSKWQVSSPSIVIDKTFLNNFINKIEKECKENN
ncbi:TPA: FUSC family protein [Clostridium perfringens]